MSRLLETLAAELERPRELSTQVAKHLSRTYDIESDAVGLFLDDEVPRLEDYEHDLIFSPLFTPKLEDQAVFAELLGSDSVGRDQWPGLIQQLAARSTRAQLVTGDGVAHSIVLREVTLERYVYRLRLDASIPESLLKRIDQAPSADRPLLKAVARRVVWESDARRNILVRYLSATVGSATYSVADTLGLLKFVEDYKPADMENLLARIPRLQELLRGEINAAYGPKPFFSERIQEEHGGERDQRRIEAARNTVKEDELAFLNRLQRVLGS